VILEAIKSRAEMYDDTNLFIKIANLEKILTAHEGERFSREQMFDWMADNLVYINGKNYIDWELAKRFVGYESRNPAPPEEGE